MNPKRALRQARYVSACWWLAQGIDLVPLKPQAKELQPGYGARQMHITSIDFARQWFLHTDANLGVVLGGPARLAVTDWDDAREYEAWHTRTGASMKTRIEQTARGYHVFFAGQGLHSAVAHGCELKTAGVCMVAPSVHPSGVVYRVLQDVPIATLNGESTLILFPFLSAVLSKKNRRDGASAMVVNPFSQSQTSAPAAESLIARIKTARLILDEMVATGMKLRPVCANTWVGLCPFHPDHTPSLWVNPQRGLWGCNRPDCPATGTHDVINFRAMHRGISNEAAIRELARELL